MVAPYKAGPFLGVNNKLPGDKLRVPRTASGGGGAFVRDAVNADLTAAGSFQRRPGSTLVLAGNRCRSLWAAGDAGYFADGNRLLRFDGIGTVQVGALSAADALVSFTQTPRGVVWSDASQLCLIGGASSRPLAVPAPNPEPAVAAGSGGSLPQGSYLVAFANLNSAGERSALTPFNVVAVPANGAIDLTFAAGRTLDIQVFVSAVDGSQLYSEAIVAAAATSARLVLVTSQGSPVTDELEAAMPPGSIVREYRGRLLTAYGNTLFYSNPYDYGTYRPATGYVLLDAPVTLCEPDEDGVYIATALKTWFCRGADFASADLQLIAPFGAIPNTAVAEPNTLNLLWSTPRGAARAANGALVLVQDANVAFSQASNGAALFREENGLSQLISVLTGVVPTGAASASSYMDAETVN